MPKVHHYCAQTDNVTTIGILPLINSAFKHFVENEILPFTDLDTAAFWQSLHALIAEFSPRNRELLANRAKFQEQLSQWHTQNFGPLFDPLEYRSFLQSIGYIVQENDDFTISTEAVDPEIATMAGPQLVVPLKNARFALNAANARWGSLYDALYGSDVIDKNTDTGAGYNAQRGAAVIQWVRNFLDQSFPLEQGSHHESIGYRIDNSSLMVSLSNGSHSQLKNPEQCMAFTGSAKQPRCLLLKHNGLHVEIQFDQSSAIGKSDKAGISDVIMEAALTTIMDCEDSVAAVDSVDKIEVYRNWLELMRGTLTSKFVKGSSTVTRTLNPDRSYQTLANAPYHLSGRCLLFNRNVGMLMTTNLLTDHEGKPVPEHIIDGVITCLGSMIDMRHETGYNNSTKGSIYIVKPKMHGPDEVRFNCDLFSAIETMLGLPEHTVKIGIMDEERRTTVNLKECIRAAQHRLVFINTGFLDRTGDEISSSMEAGPFLPKEKIKQQPWIQGYEDQNVAVGLSCGLSGRAQIGKGMWAMPDEMKKMLELKIQHPLSGATTAWVPSPTAAVLHALHYHQVDVFDVQSKLTESATGNLDKILTIPLLSQSENLTAQQIQNELNNNVQSILGYVVRWVEMGIGCSKVPDINNIGLMEDRATLRISAIHIANWLHHGICSKKQVEDTLEKMARVVDSQNAKEPNYSKMCENLTHSLGFQAARALIFENASLPNGYTEPLLHAYRIRTKAHKQQ